VVSEDGGMSLRYLSVCSGIEAATVAWHSLGWEPVAFSDIEKFPGAVLAHHYPNVPNLGDMTKFNDWPDYAIDLLVGGTPCQAFSVAGLRKGLSDTRGNLTLTFLGIAQRYRPKWVVWENVPGVLSDRSNAFGHFLAGLAELGYGCAYRVLDAQFFGVAQRRRRVFVVGHLGAWQRAAAVLFEPESLRGDPAPSREARQTVAPTLDASTGGSSGKPSRGLVPEVAGSLGARGVRSHTELDGHGAWMPTPAASSPCLANPLTARMHKGANTTCDEGQTLIPCTKNQH
jgi:DNA (cytosine-5)-methyltransferase 1